MEFGDVAFMGLGPGGVPIPVGVEIKQVGDALACMTNGRFSGHQLTGLVTCYQDPWLLVEGDWRPNGSGALELFNQEGKYWFAPRTGRSLVPMYRDFDKWLLTQLIKGGVRYARTYNRQETVQFIRDLYAWWAEGWESHKSHRVGNDSGDWVEEEARSRLQDRAVLTKPTLLWELARKLPGVGGTRAAAVAAHFRSVEAMMGADRESWQRIEGIGKGLAKKVWEALHG
jgi:ERCC4-type nuclease